MHSVSNHVFIPGEFTMILSEECIYFLEREYFSIWFSVNVSQQLVYLNRLAQVILTCLFDKVSSGNRANL